MPQGKRTSNYSTKTTPKRSRPSVPTPEALTKDDIPDIVKAVIEALPTMARSTEISTTTSHPVPSTRVSSSPMTAATLPTPAERDIHLPTVTNGDDGSASQGGTYIERSDRPANTGDEDIGEYYYSIYIFGSVSSNEN